LTMQVLLKLLSTFLAKLYGSMTSEVYIDI
jgi:hypothetical protein